MALQEIELDLTPVPFPAEVERLLADAEKQIDALFESEQNKRLPRYIPSDPRPIYLAVRNLLERNLPLGRTYCEWGSGFGIGVCLAKLLGCDAFGVELEGTLITAAEGLAERHRLDVKFLQTSFYPEGFEPYDGQGATELLRPEDMAGDVRSATSYTGLDLPVDEIDIFYVFPWPSEHELMLELFEAVAGEGAILLICFGEKDVCAFLKK